MKRWDLIYLMLLVIIALLPLFYTSFESVNSALDGAFSNHVYRDEDRFFRFLYILSHVNEFYNETKYMIACGASERYYTNLFIERYNLSEADYSDVAYALVHRDDFIGLFSKATILSAYNVFVRGYLISLGISIGICFILLYDNSINIRGRGGKEVDR